MEVRSVRGVDFMFVALLLVFVVPVAYEFFSTRPPAGWDSAMVRVLDEEKPTWLNGYGSNTYNRMTTMRNGYVRTRIVPTSYTVSYQFEKNRTLYSGQMRSLPILLRPTDNVHALNNTGALVYFDPKDPSHNVVPAIGAEFTGSVFLNYGIGIFLVGVLQLVISGMGAMNNERWHPGMKTPY